jgi:hypothetical protein
VEAASYRGKTLRVGAAMRAEWNGRLTAFEGGVLWLEARDEANKVVAFASTVDHPVRTKTWVEQEVSLVVPEKAATIRYGVSSVGVVRLWIDDVLVDSP